VLLEVADTGIGMSSVVMAKIFDPFFTTKATGHGLGLSAMLGILRGHKAGLGISSEPGKGSSFRICFPASTDGPGESTPGRDEEDPRPIRGRILLVDDEVLILQTVGHILEVLGLEVFTAKDGVEALAWFRQADPRPDLVLMDLTMPRMDGHEAFQAMHDLDPSVPIILSSGFSDQAPLWSRSGQKPAGFIQKPYQIKELQKMLQGVMARGVS
jgi:CheY-like chemotaxis protein